MARGSASSSSSPPPSWGIGRKAPTGAPASSPSRVSTLAARVPVSLAQRSGASPIQGLVCLSGIRYRRFPGELPANPINPLRVQPEYLGHHVVDLLSGRVDIHLGEGLQGLILELV